MGCFASRPAPSSPDVSQPHPTQTTIPTTTSRTAINLPATTHNRNASYVSTASLPQQDALRQGSTSTRPNRAIRSPSPVPRCPLERALQPWTASQLASERDAFFDTRVTGDPAVWNALRIVCEMLRSGDVTGAQGIMDTVGLTCPTGRIKSEKPRGTVRDVDRKKGGVFDEMGRGYDIPGWIVADPEDLVPEPEVGGDGEKAGLGDSEGEDGIVGEKGKQRALDIGERIKLRARLSDRGSDVVVEVGVNQKVRVLLKRISEQDGRSKKLRLLYLGKILKEDQTLKEQGWQEGHVVNALVVGE